MIEIYDSSMASKLGEIPQIVKGALSEKINADKTLTFEAPLTLASTGLINVSNTVKYGTDWYDIAAFSKGENGGRTPTVTVECEHVSYRLNESTVEYFTEIGTPTEILTAILADTDFTVGTVEFSELTTFSLQQETSVRNLLMQFATLLGAEIDFNGFEISLLTQRGSSTPKDLTANKNLTLLSISVDKRTLDDDGNPTIAYSCAIYDPVEALALGDSVTLEHALLGIDVTLRIVGITINPYNVKEVSIDVGNYVRGLEDDIYRIETQAVSKDALMNGCRIGPEYGFEAIRNDKLARAFFRSDGFSMQSGDGSGTSWTDKIYFDPISGKYVFDGELSATVISALSALITPNLYAGKATISELTVDQLDTSDKVRKYLSADATDDNFQRVFDQYHEFITAQTDGLEANKVQATNRDDDLLYWTDETHTAASADVTAYPVYTYAYTEDVKMKLGFRLDPGGSGFYIPVIEMGVGTGVNDNGKGIIYKSQTGLEINYYKSTTGEIRQVKLGEDGIIFTPLEDIETNNLKSVRYTIGTAAGWAANNCDYLCDGTADDAEINAAIGALPATGGEIRILDGTYNITAAININKSNVKIRGNGASTILKRAFDGSSLADSVVYMGSVSHCEISDLSIDGNALNFYAENNCGIYFNATENSTASNIHCFGNENSGIYLDNSSADITISNCRISGVNSVGILINDSSRVLAKGNTINDCYSGVQIVGSIDNSVCDNVITSCAEHLIHLTDGSTYTRIENNMCAGAGGDGIHISGYNIVAPMYVTVVGNHCKEVDNGIYISDGNNAVISGNNCRDNTVTGILLTLVNKSTVSGNNCCDNPVGIKLEASEINTITGNCCVRGDGLAGDYASSQHTIHLYGTGNNNNLITSNMCMGKAVTVDGGTGNTLDNNKDS